MAKANKLYYSYSPVTQELMVSTVAPNKLSSVDNVMVDTDHYLQVDRQTGETKGFFVLFVEADDDKETFGQFPTVDELISFDAKKIFPQL